MVGSRLFVKIFLVVIVVVFVVLVVSCTKSTDLLPRGGDDGNDSSIPLVSILSPTNNQVYNTNSVVVSGVASDDGSGVSEVWLKLNSDSYDKMSGTTSWISNLSGLSDGTNTIYVYAVDNAGNTSITQSVSFVISTSVSVVVNNPTNNQVFNTNGVSVSGTASSYSGVSEVWLKLNNGSYGKVSGTGIWISNLSGLSEGTNVVYVYAVDNAGNVSVTQGVSFVVSTSVSVVVNNPTNNQVFNTNGVSVSGTASSYSGVKEVWLKLNNGSYGKVSGTTSWVSNLSGLSDGTNIIYVYAVDNAGNTSTTQSVSFVYMREIVFVSPSGDDGNSGIFTSYPVKTINKGIEIAVLSNWNKVYLAQGIYTPGNGLVNDGTNGVLITNNNIRLIGGWDTGFNNIVWYSELDGNNSLKHIIFATNVSNLVMSNLVVRKGNANGSNPHDRGGGIYLGSVSYSLISNVVVSNNGAQYVGGGVYLSYSANNTISGSVSSNKANNDGGGVYLYSSANNTINGVISGNSATNGGGLYILSSGNNTISGVVSGNSATNGGGLYLLYSVNNTISGVVSGNRAGYGGGLYLYYSGNNTISGSVSSNSANWYGGGLYIFISPNTSILNSYITNNWTTSGTNSVIHLSNSGLLTGLVIFNCWIGGNNNTTAIGIFEEGTSDVTNQVLKNNKFITNKLRYLYKDYVNGYIATNDSSWINVNNPSKTGATSDSTNNTAVNM